MEYFTRRLIEQQFINDTFNQAVQLSNFAINLHNLLIATFLFPRNITEFPRVFQPRAFCTKA
uniref:Uncharacterized protein n=1 Tax=Tetranychus urticae TaxID=32264 RepID=T1JR51_TETUR